KARFLPDQTRFIPNLALGDRFCGNSRMGTKGAKFACDSTKRSYAALVISGCWAITIGSLGSTNSGCAVGNHISCHCPTSVVPAKNTEAARRVRARWNRIAGPLEFKVVAALPSSHCWHVVTSVVNFHLRRGRCCPVPSH